MDSGAAYYEGKYRQRTLDNLKRKAQQLGFDLTPQPDHRRSFLRVLQDGSSVALSIFELI